MTRIDLMIRGGAIKEYRHMNWWRKMACRRQSNKRLRYVCPPDVSLLKVLETVFWLLIAGAVAACVILFPVVFARWWLCA